MINDQEREELKKVIGKHYTRKVLNLLNQRNAMTGAGRSFSIEYIRQVFNGHHQNEEVELAIYDLRDKIISIKEELRDRKKKLTSPKMDKNQ